MAGNRVELQVRLVTISLHHGFWGPDCPVFWNASTTAKPLERSPSLRVAQTGNSDQCVS